MDLSNRASETRGCENWIHEPKHDNAKDLSHKPSIRNSVLRISENAQKTFLAYDRNWRGILEKL